MKNIKRIANEILSVSKAEKIPSKEVDACVFCMAADYHNLITKKIEQAIKEEKWINVVDYCKRALGIWAQKEHVSAYDLVDEIDYYRKLVRKNDAYVLERWEKIKHKLN